jgi:hypothetical protein
VPNCALPPGVPFTCHRTPVLEVPVMVASNCSVPPAVTVALVGEIETEIGSGGMLEVPLLGVPVAVLLPCPPQPARTRRRRYREYKKTSGFLQNIGPNQSNSNLESMAALWFICQRTNSLWRRCDSQSRAEDSAA